MRAGSAVDDAEIRERLQWLVKLRWFGCAGVLAVTHVVRLFPPVHFPLLPVYLILGCAVLYNLYFRHRLQDYCGDLQGNAVSQIGLDYLVLTAAVYFSGGSDSPFLYYYLFHIVISGILLPKSWTFGFAVAAFLLPATLIVLAFSGVLPSPPVFGREPVHGGLSVVAAHGGVYASTLFLTACFTTCLADKLHRKREEVQRFHFLSERLRSTIILDDVIAIVKEELLKLTGAAEVKHFSLDTGRLSLVHRAETSRAHRYHKNFGLLMIDIDHFKSYNDTYGHPRGDMILRTAAMVHNLRDTDLIGRYGGEEFIALLPETERREAERIGERIRRAVENHAFECAGLQPGEKITVSIGVASYPDDGLLPDEIIHAADKALYCAKSTGRNRVVVTGPLL